MGTCAGEGRPRLSPGDRKGGPPRRTRPAAGAPRAGSDLTPAGNPRAVLDLEVAEERRRLLPHDLADLAEDQADLLLGAGRGPGLDRVAEGAHVRRPDQAGGHALGGEAPHERRAVLLLG